MTKDLIEKMAEGRRRISRAINMRKLVRRRRKSGEIPSKTHAIANHCRECMGFESDEYPSLKAKVIDCPATECWLWCWRSGSLEIDNEKT